GDGFVFYDSGGVYGIVAEILGDVAAPIAVALIVTEADLARIGIEQVGAVSGAIHPAFNGVFWSHIAAKSVFGSGAAQVAESIGAVIGPVVLRILVAAKTSGAILG